jgi:hypothetical protein
MVTPATFCPRLDEARTLAMPPVFGRSGAPGDQRIAGSINQLSMPS